VNDVNRVSDVNQAGTRPNGPSGLPLTRRLVLGFSVLATVTALALGTAAWAYVRQVNARNHLVDVVDAARLDAQSLLSDYVDEETGVRGYVLSHQESFLQPYTAGVTSARDDLRQLGALVARDRQSSGLLVPVERAMARWRAQFALPAIAATRRGESRYAAPAEQGLGKVDFDRVRGAFAALNGALRSSATSSTSTLEESEDTFLALGLAVVALLVVAGSSAIWALRSWVIRPLAGLRDDVREVAGGELDHPVRVGGPPDLVELAGDVDSMRQRIVSEVRLLAEASAALGALNEDLSRSNLELEQFAYVASHDLQEPLRKVVSFCELLSRRYASELDERAREYIAFAVDGATRMQALINDLLAFSRVGRNTSKFEIVPLDDVFRQALVNLDAVIAEAGAHVSSAPLPSVRGDRSLLTALFQNLIGNAIKFNEGPRPTAEITARQEGDMWQFAISDNGIGIEPRFADRVFVIFQRLHGRDVYGGTGIGLALCKKIIDFHGGEIWLDTNYSSGARICWALPTIGAE
jgi:signal transduction histidine kinase